MACITSLLRKKRLLKCAYFAGFGKSSGKLYKTNYLDVVDYIHIRSRFDIEDYKNE